MTPTSPEDSGGAVGRISQRSSPGDRPKQAVKSASAGGRDINCEKPAWSRSSSHHPQQTYKQTKQKKGWRGGGFEGGDRTQVRTLKERPHGGHLGSASVNEKKMSALSLIARLHFSVECGLETLYCTWPELRHHLHCTAKKLC